MPKKLILIDGNAFMHRAYHALPKTLTLPDGTLVNALYGFSSFLIHMMEIEKPDYIAITFDHKAPTFRHLEFVSYKATRQKAPDDFYSQIPLIRDSLTALNVQQFSLPGYESDDLIGSIHEKFKSYEDLKFVIYTGDHDLMQLIDKNTEIAMPISGFKKINYIDEAKFQEKYGFPATKIIDYKALRGDSSDNIPGVKGIGEKTAVKLLQKFPNLEEIYLNINEVEPKISDKLKQSKENAYLSKKLATLCLDINLNIDLEDLKIYQINTENLIKFFEKFQFKSLIARIKRISHYLSQKIDEKQTSMF